MDFRRKLRHTPILRQTMQDFVQSNMNNLLSCRYNMDTNRMEARFEDGTILSIDCIAIEDEYGNTPAQRAELDWLLYNKPLEDAQMVLKGEVEYYLSLGCDHGRLEDEAQYNNKSRQVFYKVGTCRDSFCLIYFSLTPSTR